jgi:DNA-binding Xre family transcriptional regulator
MSRVSVRLRIRDLAIPAGIENAHQLASKTGMPYETCRLLWSEKTRRISLDTIEKLCEAFGVVPGQLFFHTADYDRLQRRVKEGGRPDTR